MEKILYTKTTASGPMMLIQKGKTFKTVLRDNKYNYELERNHRTLDGACRRFSKYSNNARPYTREFASNKTFRDYGWPNAYFDKLEKQQCS